MYDCYWVEGVHRTQVPGKFVFFRKFSLPGFPGAVKPHETSRPRSSRKIHSGCSWLHLEELPLHHTGSFTLPFGGSLGILRVEPITSKTPKFSLFLVAWKIKHPLKQNIQRPEANKSNLFSVYNTFQPVPMSVISRGKKNQISFFGLKLWGCKQKACFTSYATTLNESPTYLPAAYYLLLTVYYVYSFLLVLHDLCYSSSKYNASLMGCNPKSHQS